MLSPVLVLVTRSKAESYQCDALSSMVQLNESHFNSFHTFRLEWQPGDDGYVHWYMDDEFKFGVEAAGLQKQKSKIPNEPSYVIINTAISTSWGFPNPPPGCTEYDCKDTAKQCGMNPGWCKTLPAEYLIDYVRIYQNKNDPRQTVGCNPKDYPTKRFIKAHESRYKALEDTEAIKKIVTGGGSCSDDSQCGEGACRYSLLKYFTNHGFKGCDCVEGWQGPQCLVPTYQNDFEDWDVEPEVHWISPYISPFFGRLVLLLVVILCFVIGCAVRSRSAHGKELSRSDSDGGRGDTVIYQGQQYPTTEMTSLLASSYQQPPQQPHQQRRGHPTNQSPYV